MINNDLKIIENCEVCDGKELEDFLNLGEQPLCDDLAIINSEKIIRKFPIDIGLCKTCYTAHQRFQVNPELLFPESYHYRPRFTNDVINGMRDLVESAENYHGSLEGIKVLDVGCNDGSLLKLFKEKGAITYGIEPTDAINDSEALIDYKVNDFFTVQSAQAFKNTYGNVDIVTFTNVFAHIEDLNSLIEALKIIITAKTKIIIENHYLGSVISAGQFDTFYHEHPRTYSLKSFTYIAEKLNLNIFTVEFPKRYGGNIRVHMCEKTDNSSSYNIEKLIKKEEKIISKTNNWFEEILKWKNDTKDSLQSLIGDGNKIVGKAFPGRASMIINFLEIDENIIPKILEKPGSKKIGHYVPGTKIKIEEDDNFNKYDIIINFSWHINKEIVNYLRSMGYKKKIFAILPDFKEL